MKGNVDELIVYYRHFSKNTAHQNSPCTLTFEFPMAAYTNTNLMKIYCRPPENVEIVEFVSN